LDGKGQYVSHFDDAKALVNHAKSALPKLEQNYQSSLNEKTIKPSLLIDIKNITENLRAALDYSARRLVTRYGSSKQTNPKIYFPYAAVGMTQAAFRASKRIEVCIPGITKNRPDIVARLESYQHFADPVNRWLRLFMDLNNENKHEKLTQQTRKEERMLRIESAGVRLKLRGEKARMLIEGQACIGDLSFLGDQTVTVDQPAAMYGVGTQTIIVWVSFTFDSNGEQVLPFLTSAVCKVEQIVNDLAAL
jgi:hypothetical protein